MIKYFCDWCKLETTDYYGAMDKQRKLYLKKDNNLLKAEVTISMNGSYNSHHICGKCVMQLLREGTD